LQTFERRSEDLQVRVGYDQKLRRKLRINLSMKIHPPFTAYKSCIKITRDCNDIMTELGCKRKILHSLMSQNFYKDFAHYRHIYL